jgi:hypothetical protein
MAIKETFQADMRTIVLPFPASTAYAIGDLLYIDSGVPKKASAKTDSGSLIGNQRDFAATFLGVAGDQRLATETSTGNDAQRMIISDGVFLADCASATFEIGDLVGVDRNTGATVNYNQQVAKVTNPNLAIGYVLKRYASATTTVLVRLMGKYNSDNLLTPGGTGLTTLTDADSTLTHASGPMIEMTPTATRKVILPSEALGAGCEPLRIVNLAAATHALTVRNSADAATIGSIPATKSGIVWSNGTTWRILVSA